MNKILLNNISFLFSKYKKNKFIFFFFLIFLSSSSFSGDSIPISNDGSVPCGYTVDYSGYKDLRLYIDTYNNFNEFYDSVDGSKKPFCDPSEGTLQILNTAVSYCAGYHTNYSLGKPYDIHWLDDLLSTMSGTVPGFGSLELDGYSYNGVEYLGVATAKFIVRPAAVNYQNTLSGYHRAYYDEVTLTVACVPLCPEGQSMNSSGSCVNASECDSASNVAILANATSTCRDLYGAGGFDGVSCNYDENTGITSVSTDCLPNSMATCPSGEHKNVDNLCIPDNTCSSDVVSSLDSDCDVQYGVDGWSGENSCDYNETTGVSTPVLDCYKTAVNNCESLINNAINQCNLQYSQNSNTFDCIYDTLSGSTLVGECIDESVPVDDNTTDSSVDNNNTYSVDPVDDNVDDNFDDNVDSNVSSGDNFLDALETYFGDDADKANANVDLKNDLDALEEEEVQATSTEELSTLIDNFQQDLENMRNSFNSLKLSYSGAASTSSCVAPDLNFNFYDKNVKLDLDFFDRAFPVFSYIINFISLIITMYIYFVVFIKIVEMWS